MPSTSADGDVREALDTILLDAGGVLLDESEFEQARAEAAVETLSKVAPGYNLDAYWADVREAVERYAPSVYRYVIWKHSGRDRVVFDRLWAEYKALWRAREPGLRLMPGIGEILRELSPDYHLVIAGQYGAALTQLLDEHGLLELFGSTLTQDDFGITKPDPRYYEQILARSGRLAERSIMIGDRIDKDVIPAKAVGMRTIRVRLGVYASQEPRSPNEAPDVEIESVGEIPDAVRRLSGSHSDSKGARSFERSTWDCDGICP